MAADGSERIILLTNRRVGANNNLWKLAGGAPPSSDEFSVIELRLNAKGEGEGKITLTGKVMLDGTEKVMVPEDYSALPVVLKNVKRHAGGSGS